MRPIALRAVKVMNKFTKQEIIQLMIIFTVLVIISVPNFITSIRRSRDLTRKDDFSQIIHVLDAYQDRYKKFPESSNGKIVACTNGVLDEYTVFSPCEWGYLSPFGNIPSDPHKDKGASYTYLSNGNRYQLLGALEVAKDDEFDIKIKIRSLQCGNRICNFGRGYGNTPLDKSIEEYENEITPKI